MGTHSSSPGSTRAVADDRSGTPCVSVLPVATRPFHRGDRNTIVRFIPSDDPNTVSTVHRSEGATAGTIPKILGRGTRRMADHGAGEVEFDSRRREATPKLSGTSYDTRQPLTMTGTLGDPCIGGTVTMICACETQCTLREGTRTSKS